MKAKLIKVDILYIDGNKTDNTTCFVQFDPEYFVGCSVYTDSIRNGCLSVEPYEQAGNVYKCKFDGGKSGSGIVSKEWFDKQ